MQVEGISDLAALEALAEEWEDLRRRAGCRSAYLSMAWLLSWLEAFEGSGALRVMIAREGGRLEGALPLMIGSRTLARLPVRALHSLSINVAFSDILLGERADSSLEAILDHLFASCDFHILLLKGIPAGGRSDTLLRASLARRGLAFEAKGESEIYLDVARGAEAYRQARKTKFWSNVRNRRGRIEKAGAVLFERCGRGCDPRTVLPEILDVSLRSWKGREGSAIGMKVDHARLVQRLLERGAPTGHAEVWMLRLDGRAIAYRLCVRAHEVVAEFDIAYDEEFKPFSPGTLLSAESNAAFVAEGATEINLGLDFPWKQEWEPASRPVREYVIYPRSFYPRLVRWAQALR